MQHRKDTLAERQLQCRLRQREASRRRRREAQLRFRARQAAEVEAALMSGRLTDEEVAALLADGAGLAPGPGDLIPATSARMHKVIERFEDGVVRA